MERSHGHERNPASLYSTHPHPEVPTGKLSHRPVHLLPNTSAGIPKKMTAFAPKADGLEGRPHWSPPRWPSGDDSHCSQFTVGARDDMVSAGMFPNQQCDVILLLTSLDFQAAKLFSTCNLCGDAASLTAPPSRRTLTFEGAAEGHDGLQGHPDRLSPAQHDRHSVRPGTQQAPGCV